MSEPTWSTEELQRCVLAALHEAVIGGPDADGVAIILGLRAVRAVSQFRVSLVASHVECEHVLVTANAILLALANAPELEERSQSAARLVIAAQALVEDALVELGMDRQHARVETRPDRSEAPP